MVVCQIYSKCTRLILVLALGAVLVGQGGCADYVPEKATELQARSILNNLSRIQPVPDPNIPVPDVYRTPPRIVEQNVGGTTEYKLFYFCKYHRADQLQGIVHAQFASTLFGKIGQETSHKDYTVTANPATNQLIIRCPTREDVTAVLELLQSADVPPIQVRIDCLISELYADLTMDKEITLQIENFLGEHIALGGKVEGGELLPAFPGAALREPARAKFGLKVGFGHQIGIAGHEFRALVDLLISRGYLKILMNPTLEVVNGQQARIETKEHVPLQQISIRGALDSFLETRTEYYDVIDSLQITPHVFADGYIGLETNAKISAKLTPEGIVQIPIVTERTISNKENRIRHGESLIIGGIRKSEKRDVIRGVPVFKDIPVIGGLFSGRDFEERAKEIIFILTPTISTGGIPNREMVEQIRQMHEPPIPYEELHQVILDPFGFDTQERERQRQLLEAEEARMQADAEKARARMEVRRATEQADTARRRAVEAQAELERLRLEAERTRLEAEKIKAEADKLAAEAAKAQAEADKAATDTSQPPQDMQDAVAPDKPADTMPSDTEEAPRPPASDRPAETSGPARKPMDSAQSPPQPPTGKARTADRPYPLTEPNEPTEHPKPLSIVADSPAESVARLSQPTENPGIKSSENKIAVAPATTDAPILLTKPSGAGQAGGNAVLDVAGGLAAMPKSFDTPGRLAPLPPPAPEPASFLLVPGGVTWYNWVFGPLEEAEATALSTSGPRRINSGTDADNMQRPQEPAPVLEPVMQRFTDL